MAPPRQEASIVLTRFALEIVATCQYLFTSFHLVCGYAAFFKFLAATYKGYLYMLLAPLLVTAATQSYTSWNYSSIAETDMMGKVTRNVIELFIQYQCILVVLPALVLLMGVLVRRWLQPLNGDLIDDNFGS